MAAAVAAAVGWVLSGCCLLPQSEIKKKKKKKTDFVDKDDIKGSM
jgi:hypothetical protein